MFLHRSDIYLQDDQVVQAAYCALCGDDEEDSDGGVEYHILSPWDECGAGSVDCGGSWSNDVWILWKHHEKRTGTKRIEERNYSWVIGVRVGTYSNFNCQGLSSKSSGHVIQIQRNEYHKFFYFLHYIFRNFNLQRAQIKPKLIWIRNHLSVCILYKT